MRGLVSGGGWLFGLSALVALVAGAGALLLSLNDPQKMLVGQPGWHDAVSDSAPGKAACLDCHVPFVGTPRSRCLAPGCHDTLATGTPPRDGPAMPIRYHAALVKAPCQRCHDEHGQASLSQAVDYHELLPDDVEERCRSCHQGSAVTGHARTDAVNCSTCHETSKWRPSAPRHDLVSKHPCDLCHGPPQNDVHNDITGTCSDCHKTSGWAVQPAEK